MSPEDFRSEAETLAAEYRAHQSFANQWGLSHTKADYAYAHVNQLKGETAAPGAGVTIGFIDTGIDKHHAAFAGQTMTEEFLWSATDETGTEVSHGTAVASVAAAIRSLHDRSAHGVAWGADIAMFAIPAGSGLEQYTPITISGLARSAAGWQGMIDHVLAWRDGGRKVDILNLSVGYQGIIDSYSERELRENFGTAIASLAQAGAVEKTILVWSAGNAHGSPCDPSETEQCVADQVDAVSVEVMPGLAARIAELRGHSIAVVALREDGTIADFSNRCGIAAGNCIAAPGQGVRVAYHGPDPDDPDSGTSIRGYTDVAGTSVAAPFVAGGLAVMKQLFRDQLANTELVTRLLETANDEGIYADRAVYGRGAMDLRAATWPVGVLDVPVGDRADGPGNTLAATRLQVGAAFGDGIERSLAGREIAAFDTLGAPFWFDLGDFTAAAGSRRTAPENRAFMAPPASAAAQTVGYPLPSRWREARQPTAPSHWNVGLMQTPARAEGGHLALANHALALTWSDQHALTATTFTTEGGLGPTPVSGVAFTWHPTEPALRLRTGWMSEPVSVLGSSGDGAFGSLASETAFIGVEVAAALTGWRLRANAELGTVSTVVRGGIIAEVSPLTTSAAALHASMPVAGDGTLSLSVAQPLRVERGRASLQVPAGRTKAGAVVRRAVAADLVPSGRQIDVTAQLQRPLAIGELRVGAMVTHQPGHRADGAPVVQLLSGWRWSY